jgi:hypothetical protein
MDRRSFLVGLVASPFVIRESGILMPIKTFTDYYLVRALDPATFRPVIWKVPYKWHQCAYSNKWTKVPDYSKRYWGNVYEIV